jgi:hypothetical protein
MSRGPAPWKSSDVAWNGGRRPYDLLKEITVSGFVVLVVVIGMSVLFASPDPPPAAFAEWSAQGTGDFVATTLAEIDGTSLSATYGPPYQTTAQNGSTQGFGPLSPEKWLGQAIPIDTWTNYVVFPLKSLGQPQVDSAIKAWDDASESQQNDWVTAYTAALKSATFKDGQADVPSGAYGPLNTLVQAQLAMARTGALDAALLANQNQTQQGKPVWYANDQTFALMYFGDSGQGGAGPQCATPPQAVPADGGCWYYNLAVSNAAPRFGGYLAGGTWGIVNEVGNWPGAWWLVPYDIWYQFGPGLGANADLWAMVATAVVSLPFLFLPWIPGLRDIPKASRVYRLMWSDYYKDVS